jgi:hypothetical protein
MNQGVDILIVVIAAPFWLPLQLHLAVAVALVIGRPLLSARCARACTRNPFAS